MLTKVGGRTTNRAIGAKRMSLKFLTNIRIVFGIYLSISCYLVVAEASAPASTTDKPPGIVAQDDQPKAAEEPERVAEIDRLDASGFSQLHRAAMTGKPDDVKKLLAAGAKVDVRHAQYQGTPLQYAAARGNVEIVQTLIKAGAKVDARDTNSRTPLMWAADKGQTEVIRQLVKAKADVRAVNNGGWTALHYAAQGRKKIAAQLLIDSGAKTDALNSQKKTPLDLAPDLDLKLPAEAPEEAAPKSPAVKDAK